MHGTYETPIERFPVKSYNPFMKAFSAKRQLGNKGEDIASEYLSGKGFKVTARNYLKPWGEIDIICIKDSVYHFVEVKTISREMGSRVTRVNMSAEDHVHPAKLKKLARTVEVYMADIQGNIDYQIDVVTVDLDFSTRTARCKLYEQVL